MKRLYYISPSIDSADSVSKDLHSHGVTDWHFHIISKDEAGLYTHKLHSANALVRTDVVRFVERGLIVGLILSLFFAIPYSYLEAFTFNAWLSISVFCLLVSAWCAGIGGISQENYKIRRFHKNIDNGEYLIMVDVRRDDIDVIRRIMAVRHPEAMEQDVGSTLTNPFAGVLQRKDMQQV